ncbi:MAG: SpoIIIAC/SpoIIIAD family protein [Oscillospiraceae bacterium]
MDIISLAGVGIIAAALCVVLRRHSPDAALGVSIACGLIVLAAVVKMLAPSVETLSALADSAGIGGDLAAAMLKALAVCYITQLSADACRDAGESAIASKLELAGRAALALITLPVFTALADGVTGLLNT